MLHLDKTDIMATHSSSVHNFNSALFRSFFKSVYKKLKNEEDYLPSLEQIVELTKAKDEHYVGLREIPVDNIIGSEARYEDFDKDFLPRKAELQDRWSAIDSIMQDDRSLPPISVFKIGDYYFVRDGHHRVSVAKNRKQLYIDAEVTELHVDVPLTKELTIRDRFKIQEQIHFLDVTKLNRLGKGFDIKLTRPQSYRHLLSIINHYTGYLEEIVGRKLEIHEVAEEWYNRIFLPFAEGAYLDDILEKYPNRTTGDLYVWIQMNWEEVKDRLGDRISFLAKPVPVVEQETQGLGLSYAPGIVRTIKRQYIRANIGLVVTCVVLNISNEGQLSIAIVKRKYHPFEDYWSLPIAMLNENETRYDAARRCVSNALGIKEMLNFVQFKTFDNVDRTPYGRLIAFGMLGIHYGENMRMSAGGIASEIKLIDLKHDTALVYDHNHILDEAFEFIHRTSSSFSFITEVFPDEVPLKYVKKVYEKIERLKTGEL